MLDIAEECNRRVKESQAFCEHMLAKERTNCDAVISKYQEIIDQERANSAMTTTLYLTGLAVSVAINVWLVVIKFL